MNDRLLAVMCLICMILCFAAVVIAFAYDMHC